MIVADDEEGETLHESNSVYHIHKILSSENYSIGQTVCSFIEAFHDNYRNLKVAAKKLP